MGEKKKSFSFPRNVLEVCDISGVTAGMPRPLNIQASPVFK